MPTTSFSINWVPEHVTLPLLDLWDTFSDVYLVRLIIALIAYLRGRAARRKPAPRSVSLATRPVSGVCDGALAFYSDAGAY